MTTSFFSAIVALGLAATPQPGRVPSQHAVADTPAHSQQVTVRVQNNNFNDVDVYAVSQGMRWRLGTVSGIETRTFTMPRGMVIPDAEVRLIFAPIGGWDYWVSPPILVSPGDRVTSQVGNMLDFSTAWAS